jgi:hypothetical protein
VNSHEHERRACSGTEPAGTNGASGHTRTGSLFFVAGQTSLVDGKPAVLGMIGDDVTVETTIVIASGGNVNPAMFAKALA